MKQNVMLTIASLLSILFMTLHLTSDTVHARVGTAEAGGSTLIVVPILVVWLYGNADAIEIDPAKEECIQGLIRVKKITPHDHLDDPVIQRIVAAAKKSKAL